MQARIAIVPPEVGYYLAGFTDGEGSFNVSFRPRKDYPIPWKVSVSFNVSLRRIESYSRSSKDTWVAELFVVDLMASGITRLQTSKLSSRM